MSKLDRISENGTLTAKQRKALEALIVTGSVEKAALAADVGRTTIYRWQAEVPAFSEALQQAQSQALAGFMLELMSMTTAAAQAIRDGLDDTDINVRLKAASLYSARLLQFKQVYEQEERIAALEAMNGPA